LEIPVDGFVAKQAGKSAAMIGSGRSKRVVDESRPLDIDALSLTLLRGAAAALRAQRQVSPPATGTLATRPNPDRRATPDADTTPPSGDDAERVARWVGSRYEGQQYPAVVLGSPHASGVHLAVAMGVPWLPTDFTVKLDRSNFDGIRRHARRLCESQPDIAVRCGYDPFMRRGNGWLSVRWQRLPVAYRQFIADRVRTGGPVLLVQDLGRWPVDHESEQLSVQVGRRGSGLPSEEYAGHRMSATVAGDSEYAVDARLIDDLRRWTANGRHPLRHIGYESPAAFGGAVADLYRRWLRDAGRTGNRLIVESGRLTDPWHVLRAGLVPYWCEIGSDAAAEALNWWIAGSEPFTQIEVLVEPPGLVRPETVGLRRWISAARFASRRAAVDQRCARAYPDGVLPSGYATRVLRDFPDDPPLPPLLTPDEAFTSLRRYAGSSCRGEGDRLVVA
jgi:hypothetical protein